MKPEEKLSNKFDKLFQAITNKDFEFIKEFHEAVLACNKYELEMTQKILDNLYNNPGMKHLLKWHHELENKLVTNYIESLKPYNIMSNENDVIQNIRNRFIINGLSNWVNWIKTMSLNGAIEEHLQSKNDWSTYFSLFFFLFTELQSEVLKSNNRISQIPYSPKKVYHGNQVEKNVFVLLFFIHVMIMLMIFLNKF